MLNGRDYIMYEGSSHKTVINRLLDENIQIVRARSVGRKLFLITKSKDRTKIVVLFDALCYNYKIIKSAGSVALLGYFAAHPVFLAAIAACILSLILYPMFLRRIVVSGAEGLNDEVSAAIADCGIDEGIFTAKIDADKLSLALGSIDGVSFADVKVVGNALIIGIKQELPPVTIIDGGSTRSISSFYDAVISRQLIFSGTAAFKKGDIVKKGDPLIDPVYVVGDEQIDVGACGEVYGLVQYKASVVYKEKYTKRVRSGRTHIDTVIDFLGLMGDGAGSPYEMYEKRVEETVSGFFIPLSVKKITYYEIVDVEITETFEVARDRLLIEVLSHAERGVPDSARITDKQTKVREVAGSYIVEAVVTAEQRIDILADG